MENIKTILGDVVGSTSPSISEQEAAENASFGKYNYDPSSRMMQQGVVSLPGWQGYSTSPNPQAFYGQTQPLGYIGQSMMYGNNPYYGGIGMNPYMNPYFAQQPMYQQPQQPPQIQIPPLNYRGQYLPPLDYEEKLAKLANDAWLKEQEQAVNNRAAYNNFGYNYYGSMMYGAYYNNPVRMEANSIIQNMQREAEENRIQFNINLGKLAYNLAYGKGKYNEEQLEQIYRGRTIENPMGVTPQDLYAEHRFDNCVPFDNSAYYQAFHNQVSAQHNAIIRPDSNMKEAFDHAGELWAMYELEDEAHRRRNFSSSYNLDGYKYFIQKSIAERNARFNNADDKRFGNQASYYNGFGGNAVPAPGTMNIYAGNPRKGGSFVDAIPSIDNDGNMNLTLSIPCNFGSKQGSTYTVSNANEAAYDKKREEFNRFVDTIPKSIYNLTPGGS